MRMPHARGRQEEFAPPDKFILARAGAAAWRCTKPAIGDRILAVSCRAICSMAFSHPRWPRDGGHTGGRLRRMIFLL
jgi:hypothetical protein